MSFTWLFCLWPLRFLVAGLTTSRCYIVRHFLLVNYLTLSLQVFENFILITWLLVCFHFYFEFLEATELVSLKVNSFEFQCIYKCINICKFLKVLHSSQSGSWKLNPVSEQRLMRCEQKLY